MTRFTVDSKGSVTDEKPTAVDFLGQRYGIGDGVVYATTSGRSPVQKFGKVVKITREVATRTRWAHNIGRATNEKYVVLTVGVRQISNGRGFGFSTTKYVKDGDSWKSVPCETRPSYPTPENIVKVVGL